MNTDKRKKTNPCDSRPIHPIHEEEPMLITRILKLIAYTAALMLLIVGCGDDSTSPPPTGSVSGKITFVGTQPDSGAVYINAAALYPIMGPTDYYEALEVTPSQTEATYRLEGMNFGTYAAIAVSWKDRTDPRHTILGMYGTSEAAGDTLPDPVVLSSEVPVLVDFWATWCGPCKAIAPMIDELAAEYSGQLKIGKVNVDENPKTPGKYGVRGIPTLILFKGGESVEQVVGAVPKSQLEELVKKAV